MRPAQRALDLAIALPALVLLAPVGLLIGLGIRLADGPPVWFRQERVGWRGQPFRIWKFRTMRSSDSSRPEVTAANDARLTAFGRGLRRLRLDELPQLLNVVRGDMSLVGPRPEVPRYVARYTPEDRRVLEFRPGITDPASLRWSGEAEVLATAADPEAFYLAEVLPGKLRQSVAYAERATLASDLRVLGATLLFLLRGAAPHPLRPGGDLHAR